MGVEAGYVSPDLGGVDSVNGTWVAGLFLDFGLPVTNLYINPFVNYWSSRRRSRARPAMSSPCATLVGRQPEVDDSDVAVMFPPFIAAGATAHMLNAERRASSKSDTKFGFQAGAGVKVGVSQSTSIMGRAGTTSSATMPTNNWSVRAGLAFNL